MKGKLYCTRVHRTLSVVMEQALFSQVLGLYGRHREFPRTVVLGTDQNLVPIGVTKLYRDFHLDTYMRGLKMYDGLFRTVA